MAQPTYPVHYLGAVRCIGGQSYTSASVLTSYPTANCMIMKSENVSVSVNASDMFLTSFNDQSYIETGSTFVFDKDCTIAIGKYKAVT